MAKNEGVFAFGLNRNIKNKWYGVSSLTFAP